jgi:hypothetical protein
MSDTKKSSANQLTTDKNFIKMADVFIAEANQLCEVKDLFLGTGFFIKYRLVLLHMLFQHFVKFFSIEFNRRLSALLVVFL